MPSTPVGEPGLLTAQEAGRWIDQVVEEVVVAAGDVSAADVVGLQRAIVEARRVYVAGQGRSGLIGRGFAQRLMHIGFDSYAVGEIIVPAVGPGDLFVAITASGTTETTVRQALKAQAAGATVGAVVERPSGELVVRADHLLHVSTSALGRPSEQHSTTLFCQVVQIMFDVCCAMLQRHLDQSDAQLNARHSNLE